MPGKKNLFKVLKDLNDDDDDDRDDDDDLVILSCMHALRGFLIIICMENNFFKVSTKKL